MTGIRSQARDFAVQFLYQCECDKLFYFPDGQFDVFTSHFQVPVAVVPHMRSLCEGALNRLDDLDKRLGENSQNWKVARMAAMDRAVLRLAVYELLESDTPPKVVLDEAIELAKKYGTENSGAFVNGVLDPMARQIRTPGE